MAKNCAENKGQKEEVSPGTPRGRGEKEWNYRGIVPSEKTVGGRTMVTVFERLQGTMGNFNEPVVAKPERNRKGMRESLFDTPRGALDSSLLEKKRWKGGACGRNAPVGLYLYTKKIAPEASLAHGFLTGLAP